MTEHVHGGRRYGTPSAESLAHLPPGREGLRPWLRGPGEPVGAPRVAVAALVTAVIGAVLSTVGAALPWITGRLSDHGVELFTVSYRGTGHHLPGFVIVAASAAVVVVAAASRARPSRPSRALIVAAVAVAMLAVESQALAEVATTRHRLLAVPLFLDNTSGVRAEAAVSFGWWLAVAGGVVTLAAGVTAFAALAAHRRRRRPAAD
ncbi:MAG: hypothetical protein ACQSGP_00440 [Frankia sp.]